MEECVSVLLTDICELHLPELMRVVFAVKTERMESAFLDVFLVIVHFNVAFSCVGINRSSTSRQAQTNHVRTYSIHTFDMVSMATLM